jgi:hypothetical protein
LASRTFISGASPHGVRDRPLFLEGALWVKASV